MRRRGLASLIGIVVVTLVLFVGTFVIGNEPLLGLDLQGGVSVVLAESAASTGANLHCPPGKSAVGQEINANHVRTKRSGMLRAVAVPLHVGRTSQVWSIEIRDEQAKLVCVSRCTLAVIDTPPDPA